MEINLSWLHVESLAWHFIDILFVFQANEGSPQPESATESTSHLNGAACRQENGFYPEKHSVPSKTIRTWREFSCSDWIYFLFVFEMKSAIVLGSVWSFVLVPTSFIRSLKYMFRYSRNVPCGLKAVCDRTGKWYFNTSLLIEALTHVNNLLNWRI